MSSSPAVCGCLRAVQQPFEMEASERIVGMRAYQCGKGRHRTSIARF
jgi:hypothetical protein